MATFEEAATCPKCGNRMETALDAKASDKRINREVYVAICRTAMCSWFGTGRAIQLDNGIVFERQHGPRGQDKSFPVLTNDQLSAGQRMVEDAVNRDLGSEGRPS